MTLPMGLRGLRGLPMTIVALGLGLAAAPLHGQSEEAVFDPTVAAATFDTAWTRISQTYYDSAFGGLDWDAVRDELLPQARAAEDVEALRDILREMVDRIGDSHFGVIPQETADALNPDDLASGEVETPGSPGFEVRIVDGRVVVSRVRPGKPADVAGVQTGWVLTHIRDVDVGERIRALDELDSGARAVALTNLGAALNGSLTGDVDSPVAITFLNAADEVVELELEREEVEGQPVSFGNLPTFFVELDYRAVEASGGCVGYIRFNVWLPAVAQPFGEAVSELADCQGIVLDIRGNPGGAGGMVMGMSGYFVTERQSLGIMRTRQQELNFMANPRRIRTADGYRDAFAGPVAILTDELSASTSEIFALGMQTIGRARVFGETTAGQALPARMERLPNGDVLMYAFADLTGPDGTRIEGRGAIPDDTVPLRRQDLLEGRDAQLEAAVRWIETGAGGDTQPD